MTVGSGLDAQLGIGEESTYGTGVTPTRFYEFTDESLKLDIGRLESKGIRSGKRVQRSDRWAAGKKDVGGSVSIELANKSLGLLLKHMFGTVATTGPVGSAYTHTFTPGDLVARMLTVQVGRPDIGATVRAFTYEGVKVKNWEVSCKVDEIGMLKLDLVGEDETTVTALATASYPSTLSLLTFVNGTVTIAGSSFPIHEASLSGDNGLDDSRYYLGAQLRSNPLEADWRGYKGSLNADFVDLTAYNRFINGTEAALVLLFRGALISGSDFYDLQFTCNVRFDGDTPTVGGPDVVKENVPFVCLDSGAGAGAAITCVYKTTDTTP